MMQHHHQYQSYFQMRKPSQLILNIKITSKILQNDINTFNKQLIFSGIESGRIKRIALLNQMGLYLLIIKLTVYLMRKEDPETFEQRNTFG